MNFLRKSFTVLVTFTLLCNAVLAFQPLTTVPSDSGFQSAGGYILSKDTNNTFDRSTDSLEAIRDRINEVMWGTNGTSTYYTTGNVGIGTTAPSSALQVVGTATATAFTDGVASWLTNALSGFTSIGGTTLTDGTFSATGGAFTGVTSISDGVASWLTNALSGFTSISGTTLTDGTFSVSAGAITGATTAAIGTSTTTPLVIGGTATTSDLSLKTTSGVGAAGADMHFLVGNNGATEAMTILNSGNVGVGTTAPAQKLHVEGQCVTGDTELRIMNEELRIKDGESEYVDVQIKDVEAGDYVLSLNEETGELVPARINGLLDMGVKTVFELTTASGKKIRTTGNHPYLARNSKSQIPNPKQIPNSKFETNPKSETSNSKFQTGEWIKVIYPEEGMEIAVADFNEESVSALAGLTIENMSTDQNFMLKRGVNFNTENDAIIADAQTISRRVKAGQTLDISVEDGVAESANPAQASHDLFLQFNGQTPQRLISLPRELVNKRGHTFAFSPCPAGRKPSRFSIATAETRPFDLNPLACSALNVGSSSQISFSSDLNAVTNSSNCFFESSDAGAMNPRVCPSSMIMNGLADDKILRREVLAATDLTADMIIELNQPDFSNTGGGESIFNYRTFVNRPSGLTLRVDRVEDENGDHSFTRNVSLSNNISFPAKSFGEFNCFNKSSNDSDIFSNVGGKTRNTTMPEYSAGGNLKESEKSRSWVRMILPCALAIDASSESLLPLEINPTSCPDFFNLLASLNLTFSSTKNFMGGQIFESGSFGDGSSEAESGSDVLLSESGIVLQDFLSCLSGGEHLQNLPDHNPSSRKSGFAVANVGINDDVVENSLFHDENITGTENEDTITLDQNPNYKAQMSSQILNPNLNNQTLNQEPGTENQEPAWTKVIYLSAGDEIAVADEVNNAMIWEEIVSIEELGKEQVYDIEVEGTQNFVANGIIAHNTYLSGNTGIGTTDPQGLLDVRGSLCLNGGADCRTTWPTAADTGYWTQTGSDVYYTGKVGIGTTAPTAQLHSKGNLTTALTGTVSVTISTTAVVGTTTVFTTELAVGDSIKIADEIFTVSAIASDTALTLDSAHSAGASAVAAYSDPSLFAIDNGDSVNKVTVNKSGDLAVSGTITAGTIDGGFTAGSVIFEGASGLTEDNANFFYGSGALKVGTSTTTPLLIGGTATTSDLNLKTTSGVGAAGADMHFLVGNNGATEAMTILNSGNTGIGTTDPQGLLDVRGSLCLNGGADCRTTWPTAADTGYWTQTGSDVYYTGKVGIGTTAPTAQLHSKGNLTTALTGTIAVTNASADIVGTTTAFDTELTVGDSIKINAEIFTVSAITSATALTLDSTFAGTTASGLTGYSDPDLFEIDNGDAVAKVTVNKSGNLNVTGTITAGTIDGGFTAGSVIFEGASGLTEDNANFFYGSGALKVGTSTTTPLLIGGTATTSDLNLKTTSGVGAAGADMHFLVGNNGGTEAMTILNSGNVGIGTTTPQNLLHLSTASNVTGLRIERTGGATGIWDLETQNFSGSAADFVIKDSAAATTPFVIQKTSGNVGIGTTTPSYKLTVDGERIAIVQGSDRIEVGQLSDQSFIQAIGQPLAFWVGNNERVRVLNNGNVGIGTTAPGAKLSISGGDSVGSLFEMIRFNRLGDDNRFNSIISASATGGNAKMIFNVHDGVGAQTQASVLTLMGNGNVGIGTTVPSGLLNIKGNLSSALTGTVAVTNLSTAVVGTTTVFTTELAVGDSIKIGTETFTVSVITDALNLTLDSAYQGVTASGLTGYKDPTLLAIDNGDGVNKVTVTKSGNVGIGTTAPGSKLSVNGGISAGSYSATAAPSNGMIISGNIGIGTTGPGQKLHIEASTSNKGIQLHNTVHGDTGSTPMFLTGENTAGDLKTVSIEGTGVGDFAIRTGATTLGAFGTQRMVILNNGNVGIGTTAPTTLLSVFGNDKSLYVGDATAGITITGRNSIGNHIISGGSYSNPLKISSNYAVSLQPTSGNVGIGTTSPTSLLELNPTNAANQIHMGRTSTSYNAFIRFATGGTNDWFLGEWDVAADSNFHLYSYGTASRVLTVLRESGNVGIGTTTPNSKLQVIGGAAISGNVGIGTTAPGAPLNVYQNSALAGNTGRFEQVGGGSSQVATVHIAADGTTTSQFALYARSKGTDAIAKFANAVGSVMEIKTNGNVGIGTTAPGAKLEVAETAGVGTVSAIIGDSAVGQPDSVYFMGNTINGLYGYDNDLAGLWVNFNGYQGGTTRYRDFNIGDGKQNSLVFVDGSTGNVGIGTTSPDRLFHAEKTSALTNAVQAIARFTHITSGVPAAGIGAGIEFEQETAADNNEILATIEVIATDVTAASEDGDLVFKLMAAGGAAAEKARLTSAGVFSATTFIGALTGTASGNLVAGGDAGTPSALVGTNISGTATNLTVGAVTGSVDAGGGTLEIANGTALPGTCAVGQLFQDTDSDDCANTAAGDGALCICKTANVWALISNF